VVTVPASAEQPAGAETRVIDPPVPSPGVLLVDTARATCTWSTTSIRRLRLLSAWLLSGELSGAEKAATWISARDWLMLVSTLDDLRVRVYSR